MQTPKYHIHESAIVAEDVTLGDGCRIWQFTHIFGAARLGDNCVVGQNVMIGPAVVVGNGCKIQNNVSLYNGVKLEDDVFCGPSVVFTNVLNPRAFIERKTEFRDTIVGKGATLGANSTILCGVTIGAFALVAAGAVVTKDVPPYGLVKGNPGRHVGWVSKAGEVLDETLICPRDGSRYQIVAGMLQSAS